MSVEPQPPTRGRATWIQLANLFGEATIFLFSGGVLYVLISRVSGSELLGSFALLSAWTVVFQSIGCFGVPDLVMRDVGRLEAERGRYLCHVLLLGLGASLAAAAVMAIGVAAAGYPPALRHALWIGALALVPMTCTQICRSGFVARERSEYALVARVAEFAVSFPVSVWLVLHDAGIEALAGALLAGRCVACSTSLVLLHRRVIPIVPDFDLAFARRLLPSLAIFGLSNSLGLVAANVNILMLSLLAPIEVVGRYGAASKLVDLFMLLPVVVAHVNLPQLARIVAREGYAGIHRLDHRFGLLLAVAASVAGGVALFADRIIELLYGAGFEASVTVLRILMIYYVLHAFDIHTGITLKASGRERDDVRLFSLNPVLNVVLNLLAIPALGAIGAALASTTAVLATLVLRYRHATRSLVRLGWLRLAFAPLALGALALLAIPFARARTPDVLIALAYAITCGALVARTARVSVPS